MNFKQKLNEALNQPLVAGPDITEQQYKAEALRLGITYNGQQNRPNKTPLEMFTMGEPSRTTFVVQYGQTIESQVARKNAEFKL